MPNRGELPSLDLRVKSAASGGAAMPDSETWTVIAFCVIGWLMSFYVALSSVGTDVLPSLMSQVPLG